jgi:hypothetical protein
VNQIALEVLVLNVNNVQQSRLIRSVVKMKYIQHVFLYVLRLVMTYVIHYRNHSNFVLHYAKPVVLVRKVIIEQMMVNVLHQKTAVLQMKGIQLVVQLALQRVIINLNHVRNNVLLDAFVVALIMFVKEIILAVLVLTQLIVRRKRNDSHEQQNNIFLLNMNKCLKISKIYLLINK